MRHIAFGLIVVFVAAVARDVHAITIVLDYTLDEHNENWFDDQTPDGLARRNAVDSAAAFLSAIVTNADWQALDTFNESFSLSDIAASSIFDLDGNELFGTAESDGEGYSYAAAGNRVNTTNRSNVAANEYIVYVGAFAFDSETTANAKATWNSSDRRNAAGFAGEEFNTWGGDVYFNTTKSWYAGSNPGIDPTDDYGIQDSNKQPTTDVSSDNWDWSTASDTWKGFDLRTIDTSAIGKTDLFATALHEMMHALGATTSIIEDYVGVDISGDFTGANLMQVYGGPVPGDGGHFAENVQSLVWDSDDIVSEASLDPNSLSGVRKYFTQLDAALLRDLGYQVLDEFPASLLAGDYNGDGFVDAADYTVWRNNLGDPTEADVNNNGDGNDVGPTDYALWKSQYGQGTPPGSGSGGLAAVPEPAAVSLMLAGAIGLSLGNRRRHLAM